MTGASEIAGYKKKIKKLTPEYENFSTLFHTRAETEGLYQTLSVYAGENGLVISKIAKIELTQVSKSEALAAADPKKKNTAPPISNSATATATIIIIILDIENTIEQFIFK